MTDRKDVYIAIDSERDYQQKRWGGNPHRQADDRTIDEYACYIQRYANVLIEVATTAETDVEKLHVVRKIAALCVACMERNGAPHRKYLPWSC